MAIQVLGIDCMFNGLDRVDPKLVHSYRGSDDMLHFLYIIQIGLKKGRNRSIDITMSMFLKKDLLVEIIGLFSEENDPYTTIVLLAIFETIMVNSSLSELQKMVAESLNNQPLADGCTRSS